MRPTLWIAVSLIAFGCARPSADPGPEPTPDTDAPPAPAPASQDARFGPIPSFDDGEQIVAELFTGVRLLSRTTDAPRPLRYHLIQIDPSAEGVAFMLTPPHDADLPRQTTRQTTRDFLTEHNLQLGINAHFFTPWPAEDAYADLIGLAAHNGQIYNAFGADWDQAFVVDSQGRAHIVERDPGDPQGNASLPPVTAIEAVGTNERMVRDGENTATWNDLHPRTAVGVTGSGQVLFALVDGRQEGTSEGMSTPELAEVMIEIGVVDAINLDGGGSTTLAVADPKPRVVNTPVGVLVPGTERRVGANLGVRARPWAP